MQIILAEKYLYGRDILARLLTLDGHEVSVAKSAKHALSLLKKYQDCVVLVNVFHCMYSAEVEPELTIRKIEIPEPVLFVSCGADTDGLEKFGLSGRPCSNIDLDIPPAETGSETNRILQLCNALRLSKQSSLSANDINWHDFSRLMQLPAEAYKSSSIFKSFG